MMKNLLQLASIIALSSYYYVACYTSILEKYKVQPWPLKFERYVGCCSLVPDKLSNNATEEIKVIRTYNSDLDICVQNVTSVFAEANREARVLMLSMASEGSGKHKMNNIAIFRPFQIAIIGTYADHHGYAFRSVTSLDNGGEEDFRWHKVTLMTKALASYASHVNYLVWIDADAIILDFNLDIEKYGQQYPEADIIVSADIRQGLMNSGFMIIRNTPWSRDFLQRWWEVGDRKAICDQDAFDLLYQKFSSADRSKVKLLATDILNSHPPAWKYFTTTSSVLHLMGESAGYRGVVFQQALHTLCQVRTGGILRKQLSLNLDYLQDAAKEMYRLETQEAFTKANETRLSTDIAQVMVSSHHYVDILNTLLSANNKRRSLSHSLILPQIQSEVLYIRENVMKLILHTIELTKLKLSELYHGVNVSSSDTKGNTDRSSLLQELVDLLKQGSEAGNSLFWSLTHLADRVHVAEIIEQLLKQLEQLTSTDSMNIVKHMQALLNQNLGLIYYEAADKHSNSTINEVLYREIDHHLNLSVTHLNSSLILFDQIKGMDYATAKEYAHSRQLFAASICLYVRYREYNKHKMYTHDYLADTWKKAIAQTRGNNYDMTTGKAYEMLGIVLFNAAQCLSQYNDLATTLGKEYIKESIDILHRVYTEKKEGNGIQEGVEAVQVKNMQLHAENLLQYIMRSKAAEENKADETKRMSIQYDEEGKVVYVSDDGEWEECKEDEEDCEDFYVEENTPPTKTKNPSESIASHQIQYGIIEISKEEEQELDEVRRRYQAVHTAAAEYRSKRQVSIEELPNIYSSNIGSQKPPHDKKAGIINPKEFREKVKTLEERIAQLEAENAKYKNMLGHISNIAKGT